MNSNKRQYKLIIFDLDGTLLDTSVGIINSVEYTIKKMGYKTLSQEELRLFVGPRIQDSLEKVYGIQGEELSMASNIFRNRYKEGDVFLANPYEGIEILLKRMKSMGVHIAVATNKRQDFADALLEKQGFLKYIEVVCGTDMQGKLKKEDLISRCINAFSECNSKNTIMIGDSSYDAEAAEKAGVDFVGVTYGFEFETLSDVNKWSNVGVVDSPLKLIEMI